jgi:hypothetical protein
MDKTDSAASARSSDNCGSCGALVEDDDKALLCEICERWFHTACEQIDDDTYTMLKKDGAKSVAFLHFFCTKSCNQAASKILRGVIRLEKEVEELRSHVSVASEKIAKVEDGRFTPAMAETVKGLARDSVVDVVAPIKASIHEGEGRRKEEIQSLRQDVDNITTTVQNLVQAQAANQPQAEGSEASSLAASAGIKEMANRVARKQNIVLFNVPMSNSDIASERKDHDAAFFERLCRDGLGIQVETSQLVRLGRKDDAMRPLRITLIQEADVVKVLKAKKKLNGNDQYKAISIKKDLTPLERQERKKLMSLREAKQRESDENQEQVQWEIRGDRLVKTKRRVTAEEGGNPV